MVTNPPVSKDLVPHMAPLLYLKGRQRKGHREITLEIHPIIHIPSRVFLQWLKKFGETRESDIEWKGPAGSRM